MAVLFIACLALLVGVIVLYSLKYGITPTPTSSKVKKELLAILPELKEGEIAELGSGWGTLAFALARKYPACQVEALEISPVPYFCSWLISKWTAFPNLELTRRDFFDVKLNRAALVVCYLYPGAMEKLKEKFEKELEPGTYVATHTFAVPGWKPLLTAHASDLYHTPVYLYQLKISTS